MSAGIPKPTWQTYILLLMISKNQCFHHDGEMEDHIPGIHSDKLGWLQQGPRTSAERQLGNIEPLMQVGVTRSTIAVIVGCYPLPTG